MYLIIGASGRLGSRVTRRLLDSGQKVRAHSRDPGAKLRELTAKGAEPIRGDLRHDDWLGNAMRGVSRVLMASQGLFPPSRSNHAGTVDDPGNRRIIDAAKRAGVEHIVFMSTPSAAADFPTRFIRVKHMTEMYLKGSGIPYTILRPPVFTEAHGLVMLGDPLAETGSVQFFGKGETPLRWIATDDVADYVVKAFEDPDDRHSVQTIGGPDVMSRVQVLELLERHLGKQAKRKHMPLGLMKMMRLLTKPVHPGLSDLISYAIAEETMPNHQGFVPQHLDWEGPTTVEDVVSRWAGTSAPQPVAAD